MSRRRTICRPFPPHSALTSARLRAKGTGFHNERRDGQLRQDEQSQASQVFRPADRTSALLSGNRDFCRCGRRALSKWRQKPRLSAGRRRTRRAGRDAYVIAATADDKGGRSRPPFCFAGAANSTRGHAAVCRSSATVIPINRVDGHRVAVLETQKPGGYDKAKPGDQVESFLPDCQRREGSNRQRGDENPDNRGGLPNVRMCPSFALSVRVADR
jgi:hypothetical protein